MSPDDLNTLKTLAENLIFLSESDSDLKIERFGHALNQKEISELVGETAQPREIDQWFGALQPLDPNREKTVEEFSNLLKTRFPSLQVLGSPQKPGEVQLKLIAQNSEETLVITTRSVET